MEKRKCKECGAEFESAKRHPQQAFCSRQCRDREARRHCGQSHLTKARERWRRWNQLNPGKSREYHRRWIQLNPGKAREYTRRWEQLHPEKASERNRRSHQKQKAQSLFQQLAQLQAALKEKLSE